MVGNSAEIKAIRILLTVIVVATVAVFWRARLFPFVRYDDVAMVLTNRLVAHFDLKGIFFGTAVSDYIPLTFLTLAFEHVVFGWDAGWYHVINIVLHIAATLTVFSFVWHLSKRDTLVALAVAGLFAIHPQHVEPVVWISGIKDLLCAIFYFLGLTYYWRYIEGRGESQPQVTGVGRQPSAAGSGHLPSATGIGRPPPAADVHRPHVSPWRALLPVFVCFVGALLSKAMALSFPLALVLCDYVARRRFDRALWCEKIPFVVLAVLLLFVHLNIHGRDHAHLPTQLSALDAPMTILNSLTFYVSKMFVPTDLAVYYEEGAVDIAAWQYAAVAILVLGFAWAARRYREVRRPLVFGLAFFIFTLLPTMKILPYGSNQIYADRYTYLPSVGIFFAVMVLIRHLHRRWIGAVIPVVAVLIACAVLSFQQVETWQNSEALWANAVKNYPHCSNCLLNYGVELHLAKKYGEAADAYRRALALHSYYLSSVHTNLAILYSDMGKTAEAWDELRAAAATDPNDPWPHLQMGHFYKKADDCPKALVEFNAAYNREALPEALISAAECYAEGRDYAKSETLLRDALKLNDASTECLNDLGLVLLLEKRQAEAMDVYKASLKLDPTQEPVRQKIQSLQNL